MIDHACFSTCISDAGSQWMTCCFTCPHCMMIDTSRPCGLRGHDEVMSWLFRSYGNVATMLAEQHHVAH